MWETESNSDSIQTKPSMCLQQDRNKNGFCRLSFSTFFRLKKKPVNNFHWPQHRSFLHKDLRIQLQPELNESGAMKRTGALALFLILLVAATTTNAEEECWVHGRENACEDDAACKWFTEPPVCIPTPTGNCDPLPNCSAVDLDGTNDSDCTAIVGCEVSSGSDAGFCGPDCTSSSCGGCWESDTCAGVTGCAWEDYGDWGYCYEERACDDECGDCNQTGDTNYCGHGTGSSCVWNSEFGECEPSCANNCLFCDETACGNQSGCTLKEFETEWESDDYGVLDEQGNDTTHAKLISNNDYAGEWDFMYNDLTIKFTSGTGMGQQATITAYDGGTKIATINAITTAGDESTEYEIFYPWRECVADCTSANLDSCENSSECSIAGGDWDAQAGSCGAACSSSNCIACDDHTSCASNSCLWQGANDSTGFCTPACSANFCYGCEASACGASGAAGATGCRFTEVTSCTSTKTSDNSTIAADTTKCTLTAPSCAAAAGVLGYSCAYEFGTCTSTETASFIGQSANFVIQAKAATYVATPGQNWATSQEYTTAAIPPSTTILSTGSTGDGLTATFSITSSGANTTAAQIEVKVSAPGSNYQVGDIVEWSDAVVESALLAALQSDGNVTSITITGTKSDPLTDGGAAITADTSNCTLTAGSCAIAAGVTGYTCQPDVAGICTEDTPNFADLVPPIDCREPDNIAQCCFKQAFKALSLSWDGRCSSKPDLECSYGRVLEDCGSEQKPTEKCSGAVTELQINSIRVSSSVINRSYFCTPYHYCTTRTSF